MFATPAGILSQAACDSIDSMLYALEQQTGIETVVAVVPSIGEEDCFNFCHQLLNQWGVGKKAKIMDWSFCWSPINAVYSSIPVMAWKEYFLMLSAKDSNKIYDSLPERWELGCRNGGWSKSDLSAARRFDGK